MHASCLLVRDQHLSAHLRSEVELAPAKHSPLLTAEVREAAARVRPRAASEVLCCFEWPATATATARHSTASTPLNQQPVPTVRHSLVLLLSTISLSVSSLLARSLVSARSTATPLSALCASPLRRALHLSASRLSCAHVGDEVASSPALRTARLCALLLHRSPSLASLASSTACARPTPLGRSLDFTQRSAAGWCCARRYYRQLHGTAAHVQVAGRHSSQCHSHSAEHVLPQRCRRFRIASPSPLRSHTSHPLPTCALLLCSLRCAAVLAAWSDVV